MDVYKVVGTADEGKYTEAVFVFEGMEEKEEVYVRDELEIPKENINILIEGHRFGQHHMYVLGEDGIEQARKEIWEVSVENLEFDLKRLEDQLESVKDHDLEEKQVPRKR